MSKFLAKSKICVAAITAMLILSAVTQTRLAANSTPEIWVEPESVTRTNKNAKVGDWFTVDVKARCSQPWHLMMFQVYIAYNQQYLAPSNKSGYPWDYPSTLLGITPPESWHPDYVFYGYSGTIGNPTIMDVNTTHKAIMLGEIILNDVPLEANHTYLLARFNFTIIAIPNKLETFSSPLSINNENTYLYEFSGPILIGPSLDILDGNYEISWVVPPPPHLSVERFDGNPWPLVFGGGENAVGKVFDVEIYLNISMDWNLTQANFTLSYNQTLIDIVGGTSNVTIDYFWTTTNLTFEPGKLFVSVNATSAPGPKTLIATIRFTVKYQGTAPEVDMTNLAFSDVTLWNHKLQITPAAHENGSVIIYGLGTNHDIAVVAVTASKSIVGKGYRVTVNVTIDNRGDLIETFNVTAKVNETIIGRRETTLNIGQSTIVSFTWNTSLFAYGNYTVSACAEPVPGETNTLDNNQTDGNVYVGVPGDVDGNHKVNMLDLYYIALHFGARIGQPDYVSNYDVDGDGIINMIDLYIAALSFGQDEP